MVFANPVFWSNHYSSLTNRDVRVQQPRHHVATFRRNGAAIAIAPYWGKRRGCGHVDDVSRVHIPLCQRVTPRADDIHVRRAESARSYNEVPV